MARLFPSCGNNRGFLIHRTAPHRTAPHRTAPHRTAPACAIARGSRGRTVQHIRGGRFRAAVARGQPGQRNRSEEHTSELQSLMRISYADFCLKKKKKYYIART